MWRIDFDREQYLGLAKVFESSSLDDVTEELTEFSDDAEDLAYELAYTRYALAKAEKRVETLKGILRQYKEAERRAEAAESRCRTLKVACRQNAQLAKDADGKAREARQEAELASQIVEQIEANTVRECERIVRTWRGKDGVSSSYRLDIADSIRASYPGIFDD